jgi:hypothetical protein
MMIEDRMIALRRRLDEVQYDVSPRDFVRFKRDPADDVIAGVIREVIADGEHGCDLFGRQIGDDAGVLVLHAKRRTLEAHRQLSLSQAMEALDGYALDHSGVDLPWETWVLAVLLIVRDLGGDIDAVEDRFSSIATEASAARFAIATDALHRVSTLADCRLAEVSTTYGKGLVENPELTDMPGFGLYVAPALGRERILFSPRSNLAQLAVVVADSMDRSGQAVTDAVVQDQIPATLIPGANAGPYIRTPGCLRFMAKLKGDARESTSFIVYVAELYDDDDAQALGESAAQVEGQWSAWDDRRLIVVSLQPTFDDECSGVVDLHEFEVIAQSALRDASSR